MEKPDWFKEGTMCRIQVGAHAGKVGKLVAGEGNFPVGHGDIRKPGEWFLLEKIAVIDWRHVVPVTPREIRLQREGDDGPGFIGDMECTDEEWERFVKDFATDRFDDEGRPIVIQQKQNYYEFPKGVSDADQG